MIRVRSIVWALAVACAVSSCGPTERAESRRKAVSAADLAPLARWVRENRRELSGLVRRVGAQNELRGLHWLDTPGYLEVSFLDGTVVCGTVPGRLESTRCPQGKQLLVRDWVTRIRQAGCTGFEKHDDLETRIYVDASRYVAVPNRNNLRLVEHYESWASTGTDPLGSLCTKLGDGWYLCAEPPGARELRIEAAPYWEVAGFTDARPAAPERE